MAIQGHKTPGTPRFKILCPNDEDKIPIAIQSQYRSGVGLLLYFIKHSRIDLESSVNIPSAWMV
jgi:hypothetical protein